MPPYHTGSGVLAFGSASGTEADVSLIGDLAALLAAMLVVGYFLVRV